MKFFCANVCFVSVLLLSTVGCQWYDSDEEDKVDVIGPFLDFEEPSDDYPTYVIPQEFGTEENVNTEENTIETGEGKPTTDVETVPSETTGSDFGPFDPEAAAWDSIVEKVEKLISDFKAQQNKISELEEVNRRLILKIDSIEQQIKTNSIILTNVRQVPNETSRMTLQKILHIFNKIMRVSISSSDIAVALRAESNSSAGRNKNNPIVVRFTNFATKMKVLAASNR